MFVSYSYIHAYADLPGLRASEGPQATVPSDLLITSYRSDIVVHNSEASTLALAEFDCLQIDNFYETVEISVLGHYQPSSVQNFQRFVDFILHPSITTKSSI